MMEPTMIVLPDLGDVREFLRLLLDRDVVVTRVPTRLALDAKTPGVIVEFLSAQDALISVMVVDLPFACYAGAALTRVPANAARDSIARGAMNDTMSENFLEVANVMSGLFRRFELRVRAGRVITNLKDIPKEVAELVAKPRRRVDTDVMIADYGKSRVSFLVS
jgi:hypothetical protein